MTGIGHRRVLRSVLGADPDPFRPLDPECKTVKFDQPLTPAELEQAAGLIAQRPDVELSVRQFGRAFASSTGMTPAKAIERLRIEAAQPMVENGRQTFEEIALS